MRGDSCTFAESVPLDLIRSPWYDVTLVSGYFRGSENFPSHASRSSGLSNMLIGLPVL